MLSALIKAFANLVFKYSTERAALLNRINTKKLILDGSGFGTWDWTVGTNEIVYDSKWCELLGLDPQSTEQKLSTWESRIHPMDKEAASQAIRDHLQGKTQLYENTHRMRHANGSWVWMLDRGKVTERDAAGNPVRFTGIYLDVTPAKELERLNTEIQRIAKIGGWEVDVKTWQANWTSATYEIYGIEPGTPTDTNLGYQHFDTVERERIEHFVNRCIEGEPYQGVFQFTSRSGAAKWIETRGEPVYGADGRVHKIRGTIQDISLLENQRQAYIKKNLESELIKSRLDTILQHSPTAIYECESNNNWTMRFMSPHIQEITGYPPSDFVNDAVRSYASVIHPDDVQTVAREVSNAIEKEESFDIRYRIIDAAGNTRHIWERGRLSTLNKNLIGVIFDVTDEVVAQVQVELAQRELNQFFTVSQDPLCIVGLDGVFRRANSGFTTTFGYSPSEVIGKSIKEYLHPDDLDLTVQEIARLSKGKQSARFQNRCRSKNGSFRLMSWVATPDPMSGVIYAAARDITDEVMTGNMLKEAQQIAKIGSWSFDIKSRKIEWSDQMFVMFDEQKEAGPPTFERHQSTIHPEDREYWRSTIEKAMLTGEPYRIRMRSVFADGRVLWIDAIGKSIFNSQGAVVELSGTCQDISELVESENQLKLERQKAVHAAKLASLGQMSAGVAHEINNPLLIISGNLELLSKWREDESRFQRAIATIEKSIVRISRIVNGLKKFSRTTDSQNLHYEPLANLIQEAILLTESKLKMSAVECSFNCDYEVEIPCDPLEIEQVIVNLISNSIDAIKNLELKTISISVFRRGSEAVLQVLDSGPVFSVEVENKIFEPFFTTKPVGEGTGLGLSVVKGILDQHGAQIHVNRDYPTTCFELSFSHFKESVNAA